MDYDDHCTVVIVIWDPPKCNFPPPLVGLGSVSQQRGPPSANEAQADGGPILHRYAKKSLNLGLGVWQN